jgi:hypothetical protein
MKKFDPNSPNFTKKNSNIVFKKFNVFQQVAKI